MGFKRFLEKPTNVKVFMTLNFLIPILVVASWSYIRSCGLRGAPTYHSMVEVTGAFMALAAAAACIAYAYAFRQRKYVLIGMAFLVPAMVDFSHGILSGELVAPHLDVELATVVEPTHFIARVGALLFLFLSTLVILNSKSRVRIRRYTNTLIVISVVAIVSLSVFFIVYSPVSSCCLCGDVIPRLCDFIIACLFFVLWIYLMTKHTKDCDFFNGMIILSVMLMTVSQFYLSFSYEAYDSMNAMSHILRYLSYTAPMFGIIEQSAAEIRRAEREANERAKAENNLRKTVVELRGANGDLDEYASAISHDLREPVRVITSFSEILMDEHGHLFEGDVDAQRYLGFIVEHAVHLQKLVERLKDYSYIDKYGEFNDVDLNVCVNRAIENLDIAISDADAFVTKTDLPRVRGDETLLTQVFQNLISNAIKFHEPDVGNSVPTIYISYKKNDFDKQRDLVFFVMDNGIGIEKKYQKKVFEAFEKLHGKDEYSGTGMGLSIAKKIITRHGGSIWVESDEVGGSTFCFTLPIMEKGADDAASTSSISRG